MDSPYRLGDRLSNDLVLAPYCLSFVWVPAQQHMFVRQMNRFQLWETPIIEKN